MAAQYYFAGCELANQSGHDAGRALLAALYAAHAEGPMPEILTGARGKPCFARGDWHFSITHTPRHAFCVLARQPIGIDAEELDRPIDLRLAQKILSAGELAQFAGAEDPRQALLTFWVLKEAAGKRSGEGIGFHPRHTDFSLQDPRIQYHDGCVVAIAL